MLTKMLRIKGAGNEEMKNKIEMRRIAEKEEFCSVAVDNNAAANVSEHLMLN